MVTKRNNNAIFDLNSKVQYLKVPWAMHNSDEYMKAIEEINDCYKKMLMIGKCSEVFQLSNARVPDLLPAKTKEEFILAKENIQQQFKRFLKSGAAKLNITIPTELVPNPKNNIDKFKKNPKCRILLKEENLKHEIYTNSLKVIKCEICLKCSLVSNQPQQRKAPYTCDKCQNRKDPMYFLKNNLHTVWYEVSDNGEFTKDKDGNKVPQFGRPIELTRLSMAESILFEDVLIKFHQHTCLMAHMGERGTVPYSHKLYQPCAMNYHSAKKKWSSSYGILAKKTLLH
jgi:hypothetical protein